MGCDIHCYIETIDDDFVSDVADVSLGRNYLLFAYMAGVRGSFDESFDPKGLPDKLSYGVESEYTLLVLDDETEESGCCSRAKAEEWVQSGCAKWWDDDHNRVVCPDWHSMSWMDVDELKEVQNNYSAYKEYDTMWLKDGEEVPECYDLVGDQNGIRVAESKDPIALGEYPLLQGVIAMMEALNDGDASKTRLVFWFDS